MIEHLRESVDIIQYISQYVELEKKGSNHIGLCPFHGDTNPSFKVSPEKNIFKCFSCGKGGNIFNFVMLYHHVSFLESLNLLSSYLDIDFIEPNQDLYDFIKTTHEYYRNCHTEKSMSYLKKRTIDYEVYNEFQVGYIANWAVPTKIREFLDKFITGNKNNEKGYGIGWYGANGWRMCNPGSLTFPFFDSQQRVVGFSYMPIDRISTEAKYKNSWSSDIFKKRELFFGRPIQGDECTLVEGYFDVMRIVPFTENPLGVCTTRVTAEQINRLKDVQRVRIAFDGDDAGRQGALKSAIDLEQAGHHVQVVDFPVGQDPDTYFSEGGSDDTIIQSNLYDFGKLYYDGSNFVDYMATHIGKLKDTIKIDSYFKLIRNDFPDVPPSLLNSIISSGTTKGVKYNDPTFSIQKEILKYTFRGELDPLILDKDKFDKEFKKIMTLFQEITKGFGYFNILAYKTKNDKLDDSYLFNDDILLPLNSLNNLINNYMINQDIDSLINDKLQLH